MLVSYRQKTAVLFAANPEIKLTDNKNVVCCQTNKAIAYALNHSTENACR